MIEPLVEDAIRILICGSRTWSDGGPIQAVLRQYAAVGPSVLIHGAAQGADSKADMHARKLGMQVFPFPAKWSEHDDEWCPGDWCRNSGKGFCYAAGPRRNQQMLDEGKPDVVWAYADQELVVGKGGTSDMVERAKEAHVPTYVVRRVA